MVGLMSGGVLGLVELGRRVVIARRGLVGEEAALGMLFLLLLVVGGGGGGEVVEVKWWWVIETGGLKTGLVLLLVLSARSSMAPGLMTCSFSHDGEKICVLLRTTWRLWKTSMSHHSFLATLAVNVAFLCRSVERTNSGS